MSNQDTQTQVNTAIATYNYVADNGITLQFNLVCVNEVLPKFMVKVSGHSLDMDVYTVYRNPYLKTACYESLTNEIMLVTGNSGKSVNAFSITEVYGENQTLTLYREVVAVLAMPYFMSISDEINNELWSKFVRYVYSLETVIDSIYGHKSIETVAWDDV